MGCDLCGVQEAHVEFCVVCGVDYCADCALGAHDMMHEIAAAEAERWGWLE